MILATKVHGIPCQLHVLAYHPEIPMRVTGLGMGGIDPPEPEEFEYEILDRNGRIAPWLERKLTPRDVDLLFEEFMAARTAEKYGIDY